MPTAATAPPDASSPPRGRLQALLSPGAVLLCTLACFRAVVTVEPFPYFGSDPFQSFSQVTSLTPVGALLLDVAQAALAILSLLAHRAGGGRLSSFLLVALLGTVATAVWWAGPGAIQRVGIDQARTAFSTASAFVAALALAHVCADPRRRAMCLAVLLGVAMMLLAKGVVQVLVEHPDTVAWYRRDPASFLHAQGWEPGSAQARAYERRLDQPEATAWFGLSNVFATVMAAATVGFGAVAACVALRRRGHAIDASAPDPRRSAGGVATLAVLAALSVLGLWLSHSKGGMVAAAAGAIATAGLALLAGRLAKTTNAARAGPPPTARLFPMAAAALLLAAPVLAVVARGLVGERLGELSLLFRWFYMEGAAQIIVHHPLWGVGPAGFRDAYLLVKPALAVEDVASPHSLVFDLTCSYGVVGGAALGATVLALGAGAIRRLLRASVAPTDESRARASNGSNPAWAPVSDDLKALALPLILATAAAALIERPLLTPESAVSRLAGLALWILGAWGVLWASGRDARALAVGSAGAAGVLLLHSGIEMTPIWPNAQAWFLATLGVTGAGLLTGTSAPTAGGEASRPRPDAAPGSTSGAPARTSGGLSMALIGVLGIALVALAPWGLLGWEARLREAWTLAEPVGRIQADIALVNTDPRLAQQLGITPESIRAGLGDLVRAAPARDPAEFDRQLNLLTGERAGQAADALAHATDANHLPTLRAMGRAAEHQAAALLAMGRGADALAALDATLELTAARVPRIGTAQAWAHLASMRAGRADLLDQLGRPDDARAARAAAIEDYERAAALDPRGLFHPVRLARLASMIGEGATARRWAQRALECDANARLDPVMGLSDAERAEMRRLAGPGVSAPPEGAPGSP